ncbi:hypothetical protein M1D72_17970 [Vibrio sp. AK197]
MLTKNITDELESVLQALHDEGKTPTVALVKARLTTQVPMPALVSTLKSWKSKKRVPKVEVATQPNNEPTIAQLMEKIDALTERVIVLEDQLRKTS